MWSSLTVIGCGALLAAAASFWVLRAYRRGGGGAAMPALAACSVVVIMGLLIYLVHGRPELPDAPFAARLEALKHRDPRTFSPDEALAVLTQAARENPDEAAPHIFSGEILLSLGRAPEAARAFDAALRREPRSAEALLGLGRAIVAAEGAVTPEAVAAFQQAGELSDDPAPWIYQAMAAMERNDAESTRRYWGEAFNRMAPDDPRREMARRMRDGEGLEN